MKILKQICLAISTIIIICTAEAGTNQTLVTVGCTTCISTQEISNITFSSNNTNCIDTVSDSWFSRSKNWTPIHLLYGPSKILVGTFAPADKLLGGAFNITGEAIETSFEVIAATVKLPFRVGNGLFHTLTGGMFTDKAEIPLCVKVEIIE